MKYKNETVKQHLGLYKIEELAIKGNGIWVNNKKEYEHIIPEKQKEKNLIEKTYYTNLIDFAFNNKIKLHSGFHHMNSSQALTLNLFVPLIVEHQMVIVLKLLGIHDQIEKSVFEHIEDKSEYTNFDFFIKGIKENIFFEVKYTEDKFGSTKPDQNHVEKYEQIYKNPLKEIAEVSEAEFFKEYQLWRNIIYSTRGVVVFVFPKFRVDLTLEVENAIKKLKNNDRVKILFIEDILEKVIETNNHSLIEHFNEFAKKYLNINGI